MRIQISFSDKGIASVGFLDPVADLSYTGKSESFVQVWLATCFILRQFRNLGDHPSSEGLITYMGLWNPLFSEKDRMPQGNSQVMASLNSPMKSAAIHLGLDLETAQKKYGYSLWLEEMKRLAKGFEGTLELRKNGPAFFLQTTGFGIRGVLGIGISEFSVNSVPILLTYLALLHRGETNYVEQLHVISRACARVAENKEITMVNQEMLGFDITESAGFA